MSNASRAGGKVNIYIASFIFGMFFLNWITMFTGLRKGPSDADLGIRINRGASPPNGGTVYMR
jgi:hypothetical protein